MNNPFNNIPAELKRPRQWICWKGVPKDNGKLDKIPKNPRTGRNAQTNNPPTWDSFDEAVKAQRKYGFDGVGFVFTKRDDYVGIDIDGCIDPETGNIQRWAQNYIKEINSYTEITPSGKGIHIITKGKLHPGGRKKGNVEVYEQGRFFTVTGNHIKNTPKKVMIRTRELAEFHKKVFKHDYRRPVENNKTVSISFDDERVLKKLRSAANAQKFQKLFSGDWSDYPSQSEADLALCQIIAFYTQDRAQIDRIFRASVLMRNKWDKRHSSSGETYGEFTIKKACNNQSATYSMEHNGQAQQPDDGEKGGNEKETQAEKLIEIANTAELFCTPGGNAYARCLVKDHHEIWPVKERGTSFRRWLTNRFYTETGKVPSSNAITSALGVIEARAQFGDKRRDVFIRVAEYEGNVYLDLCDAKWRAVEITQGGWSVTNNPPVCFRRSKGMLALPEPIRGGSIDDFRQFINVESESDFMLAVGFLVGAVNPRGPYLHIQLNGEQGTAKSSMSRNIKNIIDPNEAVTRSMPKDERDLAVMAENSWVLAFDNISHLQGWLSDALCRLSTGGGFSTRALYTDSDEAMFTPKKPVIINGINEVVTRGDLLDRMVVLTLKPISPGERKTEHELNRFFEKVQPRILGVILDAACCALKNYHSVELSNLPRMADAVRWIEAAAPVFGWKSGKFLDAFVNNQGESIHIELEASPLASAFLQLCERKEQGFETTAQELLDELDGIAGDKKPRNWPRSANGLGGALRRLAPALKTRGFLISWLPRAHGGKRRIRVDFTSGQQDFTYKKGDDVVTTGDDVVTTGDNQKRKDRHHATPCNSLKSTQKTCFGDNGDNDLHTYSVRHSKKEEKKNISTEKELIGKTSSPLSPLSPSGDDDLEDVRI